MINCQKCGAEMPGNAKFCNDCGAAVQETKTSDPAYDIFLSYRRDGGESFAILLRDRLVAKGYNVFLDIEGLNSGLFNTKLLSVIEGCKDFILVCSKGALDRCINDGDWVYQEINHAFKHNKNIIPLMLRGFEWPEALPGDISDLPMQNGVKADSNEYFDAAIDRLAEKFLRSEATEQRLVSVPTGKPISKTTFILAIVGSIFSIFNVAPIAGVIIGLLIGKKHPEACKILFFVSAITGVFICFIFWYWLYWLNPAPYLPAVFSLIAMTLFIVAGKKI